MNEQFKIREKKNQLINSYKDTQERIKQAIAQMQKECQKIQTSISKEFQQLKGTSIKIKEKAKQFIENCLLSVVEEKRDKEIMDIKELSSYLKTQKQLLLGLTNSKEIQQNSTLNIHEVLIRSRLQQTLRRMKKIQLQEQIKYLQSNVLVKDNLIYNAVASSTPSPAQEKQLNARLQNMIAELERVVCLSIPCFVKDNQSPKLVMLEEQQKRLKQCQNMLIREEDKISKMVKYFQSQYSSILQRLPLAEYSDIQQQQEQNEQFSISEFEVPLESELDQLIQYQVSAQGLVSKFSHKFDETQQAIDQLRKRFKKVQNLLN